MSAKEVSRVLAGGNTASESVARIAAVANREQTR